MEEVGAYGILSKNGLPWDEAFWHVPGVMPKIEPASRQRHRGTW